MLLYSLLYLTGYESISIDDIKNFRQLNSFAPDTLNIKKEQGLRQQQDRWGKDWPMQLVWPLPKKYLEKIGQAVINNKTYVIASDGDFMEE